MSGAKKQTSPEAQTDTQSPATVLVVAIADTTWRMFVPTVGLLVLGRMADTAWGTKPWGMMLGVTLGAAISAWLVKKQLDMKV